jgi:hypothetical protein
MRSAYNGIHQTKNSQSSDDSSTPNAQSGWADTRERMASCYARAEGFLDRQQPAFTFGNARFWWNPQTHRLEQRRFGQPARPLIPERFDPRAFFGGDRRFDPRMGRR